MIFAVVTVVAVMNLGLLLVTKAQTGVQKPFSVVKRHYKGDLFVLRGNQGNDGHDCSLAVCNENGRQAATVPWRSCHCQCLPSSPTFRPDTGQCVASLQECQLVPFQSPAATENIPLVSVLSPGKLVHPSAELVLNVATLPSAKCHVFAEQYLSPMGWQNLSRLTKASLTFQLVQDSKSVFLQFNGNDEACCSIKGQIVVVEFSCWTGNDANILPRPCASFRVSGTLSKIFKTSSEFFPSSSSSSSSSLILNQVNATSGDEPSCQSPPSRRRRDWLIMSFGAGLLGVTYVLAIWVYLMVQKRHEKRMAAVTTATSTESATVTFPAVAPRRKCCPLFGDHGDVFRPESSNDQCSQSDSLDGSTKTIHTRSPFHRFWTMTREGFWSGLSRIRPSLPAGQSSTSDSVQVINSVSCRPCEEVLTPSMSLDNWIMNNVIEGKDFEIPIAVPEERPNIVSHQDGQQNDHSTEESVRPSEDDHCHRCVDCKRHSGPTETQLQRLPLATSGAGTERQCVVKSSDSCRSFRFGGSDDAPQQDVKCKRSESLAQNVTLLVIGGHPEDEFRITPPDKLFQGGSDEHSTNHRWSATNALNSSMDTLDGRRKSVSFNPHDTIILGERSKKIQSALPTTATTTSPMTRKMTNFATLRHQSKVSGHPRIEQSTIRLRDIAHRSVVYVGRSESCAADYTPRFTQQFEPEGGPTFTPPASILKRSKSNEFECPALNFAAREHRLGTGSRLTWIEDQMNKAQSDGSCTIIDPGRIPIRSLVESFNENIHGRLKPCTPCSQEAAPETGQGFGSLTTDAKTSWKVVNEDSGYQSSDSESKINKVSVFSR